MMSMKLSLRIFLLLAVVGLVSGASLIFSGGMTKGFAQSPTEQDPQKRPMQSGPPNQKPDQPTEKSDQTQTRDPPQKNRTSDIAGAILTFPRIGIAIIGTAITVVADGIAGTYWNGYYDGSRGQVCVIEGDGTWACRSSRRGRSE